MIQLSADESRVLGVLIEKATTTPEQYPLSLNGVVNGANQKNNRDPVGSMTEDEAYAAVEGLRGKGLVMRVDQSGSRVSKYRHMAADVLHARPGELAILAELLLRGPQTLGELRGRASRMSPIETLEAARELVRALSDRPEPLVKEIAASPGSRAERYVQLLCGELHPVGAVAAVPVAAQVVVDPSLGERVERLEAEVAGLREGLRKLSEALGVSGVM